MKREDFKDIDEIVKATGLSEDQVAQLVLAKANEGWSNAEIHNLLLGEMDGAEKGSVLPAIAEVNALLGTNDRVSDRPDAAAVRGRAPMPSVRAYEPVEPNPYYNGANYYNGSDKVSTLEADEEYDKALSNAKDSEEPEDDEPSWLSKLWDGTKSVGKTVGGAIASIPGAIKDSWMDHRENTSPWEREALVMAMFGHPEALTQYRQAMNQNEQNEKNRAAQNEYNNYWKELEYADKKKTEAKEKDKTLATAKVEYQKYAAIVANPNAKPSDVSSAKLQMAAIRREHPDIDPEVEGVNPIENQAEKDAAAEGQYQRNLNTFRADLQNNWGTDADQNNYMKYVNSIPWIRDEDKQKLLDEIRGKKSLETQTREAKAGAIAGGEAKPIADEATAKARYKELKAKLILKAEEEAELNALKTQYGWS